MPHYIVGLTGGIGSGKTTASDEFQRLGIDVVDADVIAREVVAPNSEGLNAITQRFGQSILLDDGNLNRAKLREIIFTNEKEKLWLNTLLHPLIRKNILAQIEQSTSPYCVLSAPLLFENNLQSLVNRSLVIDIDEASQIKRTADRDNVTEAQVKSIIQSQIARDKRLALAQDVVKNSNISVEELIKEIHTLHKAYLQQAKEHV